MQIKEIMRKVVTIAPSADIGGAARVMTSKGIGSLVVAENDKIFGILTEHDILECVSKSGKSSTPIKSIMSKEIKTIQANADITEAAELMSKNKIKRLPVVDGKKIVGIITATDLIAHADEFDEPFFF